MSSNEQGIPAAARMYQLLSGFEVSQALYVVAELGVATALLNGPRSVEGLAMQAGVDAGALGRVIRFLVPLGVFSTTAGGEIEVTGLGRTLADGPPDSVRGMARYWMETHYAPFASLLETVRTGKTGATEFLGKPFFEWVNESPRLAELQNAAIGGVSRLARADILDAYQFPKGIIADLGGADGSLMAELLAREPQREGIVFDLPNIVAQATETLAAAGLSDRSTVVGGDFFDGVPAADVYVMSVVLHDWDNPAAVRILRNIAKAAAPGAHLVLLEMVMPEGDVPHLTKMVDVVLLAMVGGRERTETEWRQLLGEAGFTLNRVVPGSGPLSAIEATLDSPSPGSR